MQGRDPRAAARPASARTSVGDLRVFFFCRSPANWPPGSLPGAPRRRRYAQQLGDPHVIWPLSDWRRTVWAEHGMAIAVGGSANWCFLCLGVPLQPGVVCPARSTLSISEDLELMHFKFACTQSGGLMDFGLVPFLPCRARFVKFPWWAPLSSTQAFPGIH